MGLRKFSFTYLFPVADADGVRSSDETGDVSDLLRAADPYIFSRGEVPPKRIINDLLSTGQSDLGMGGGAEWEPFELSSHEFDALLEYLETPAGREKFHITGSINLIDLPEHVKTASDFSDWKIDEAFKDPDHFVNRPERNTRLEDGTMVTFREFWELEKQRRK